MHVPIQNILPSLLDPKNTKMLTQSFFKAQTISSTELFTSVCSSGSTDWHSWFTAVFYSFPSHRGAGDLVVETEVGKLICFLHLSLFFSLDKLSTGKQQLWSWQPDTSAVPQLVGYHRTWQDVQFPSASAELPEDPWWEHLKSTGWSRMIQEVSNCCLHNIPQNTSCLWSCDLITKSNVLQMYLCPEAPGEMNILVFIILMQIKLGICSDISIIAFSIFFKQQLAFSSLNNSLLH